MAPIPTATSEPTPRARTRVERRLYFTALVLIVAVRAISLVGADSRDVWIRWSGAAGSAAAREKGLVWDQALYDQFGWNLASQGVMGVGDRPSAFCLPGYPLLLAGTYVLAGHLPGAARWVQVFLNGLAVVFLGALARRLGGPRAEIIALFLGAAYPFYVYFVREILTETLFLAAFTAMLLAAARVQARGSVIDGVGFGIAVTIAVLTRPVGLWLVPGALVLARPWHPAGRRRRLGGLLLGALILAGAWGAWVARNRAVFGETVLLDTHGGWSLYFGQLMAREVPLEEAVEMTGYHHGDILRGTLPGGARGELEADRQAGEKGWKLLRDDPAATARTFLVNVESLWLGSDFADLAGSEGLRILMTLISLLSYPPVLLFGLVGLVQCWRTGRRDFFWAALLLLATTTVLHGMVQGGKRYRTVTVDPILMTLAAWQLSRLLARWWPEPMAPGDAPPPASQGAS